MSGSACCSQVCSSSCVCTSGTARTVGGGEVVGDGVFHLSRSSRTVAWERGRTLAVRVRQQPTAGREPSSGGPLYVVQRTRCHSHPTQEGVRHATVGCRSLSSRWE